MRKVTKAEMIEKLTKFTQDLGLTNAEIAEKLNSEFEATDANKMSAVHVGKLKEQLGLKGMKPKKKALFELVDEVEIEDELQQTKTETVDEETGEIVNESVGF